MLKNSILSGGNNKGISAV